jgi:hypothetical protein
MSFVACTINGLPLNVYNQRTTHSVAAIAAAINKRHGDHTDNRLSIFEHAFATNTGRTARATPHANQTNAAQQHPALSSNAHTGKTHAAEAQMRTCKGRSLFGVFVRAVAHCTPLRDRDIFC